MNLKKTCTRCKKDFEITPREYDFYKKIARKEKKEVTLPKYCESCRSIKSHLKSIPLKICQVCRSMDKIVKDENITRKLMQIYGLAMKQMRQNLINFDFLKEKKDE